MSDLIKQLTQVSVVAHGPLVFHSRKYLVDRQTPHEFVLRPVTEEGRAEPNMFEPDHCREISFNS